MGPRHGLLLKYIACINQTGYHAPMLFHQNREPVSEMVKCSLCIIPMGLLSLMFVVVNRSMYWSRSPFRNYLNTLFNIHAVHFANTQLIFGLTWHLSEYLSVVHRLARRLCVRYDTKTCLVTRAVCCCYTCSIVLWPQTGIDLSDRLDLRGIALHMLLKSKYVSSKAAVRIT